MKTLNLILIFGLILSFSCKKETGLSESAKNSVKDEICLFMKNFDAAASAANEQVYANMFIRTDELAVASQGKLYPSYNAVRDTIRAHMSAMQKQEIQNVDEKIFVIDQNHAVISTSKLTHITLKNGTEFTMPYALTMLLVKRNGEWKIAHYHNS